MTHRKFIHLLQDFNFSQPTPERSFRLIADQLMNHAELVAYQFKFRIAEVEFYLHSPEHPDPFVHQHRDQLSCLHWCFHKVNKQSEAIRGGTFKGLDITFGNGSSYGGILIRALIPDDDTHPYVYGPSKTVDALELFSGMSRKEMDMRSCTEDKMLFLAGRKWEQEETIYSSVRFGLHAAEDGKETLKTQFLSLPYRYYIRPELKHAGIK